MFPSHDRSDGLQLLVADDPTTSTTIGDINQNTETWWRNQAFDATTDGGAAATSANITGYMNQVYLLCTRGTDHPDLILADANYYRHYLESLQGIQRIQGAEMAEAGFVSLMFIGADVVFEDANILADHMYFLNTDFIHFRFAPNRNFVSSREVTSINQDATVRMVLWAGNMTVSNRSVQGVLKD